MDLFDSRSERILEEKAPLAARMRPRNLDEFQGQVHLVGKGKILRRAIEADRVSSLILYGPPGSGKTALAQVIAGATKASFMPINAVTAGVAQIRDIIAEARSSLGMYGRKTIVFIDEIHRFNKSQQDALLPSVESGLITLIGATTENPYFEVNAPLLSRARVFKLEPLSKEDIIGILRRALKDRERGLGKENIQISDEALEYLANAARGDARTALNALELAVLTTPAEPVSAGQSGPLGQSGPCGPSDTCGSSGSSSSSSPSGCLTVKIIDENILKDCVQQPAILYDKGGDYHYDVISAFIKSIRGSDPDAALHWLARMLEAGEDPKFICRRMLILASEDIGMADSNALTVAVSASRVLDYVGLPEARLALAHVAIYLSCAPKSNSVINAIDSAINDVRERDIGRVPNHLRDSHYKGAKQLGHGKGYKYPHSFPGNYVMQQYLPDELLGRTYYIPGDNGGEAEIKKRTEEKRSGRKGTEED